MTIKCSKSDTCVSYPQKCPECASISDVMNHYPLYQSKDFVEVVRCKNCAYRYTHVCAITGAKTLFCDYWDKAFPVEELHYCGYGKPQKESDAE